MIKSLSLSLLLLCVAQSAVANVEVSFIESAPKDHFIIKNTSKCALNQVQFQLDLTQSAGKLIFDTTASGAGVEVFQPFEVTKGNIQQPANHNVSDGDTKLSLAIEQIPAENAVSFTIDLDDTLPNSELGQIRVAGSEIRNGLVQLSAEGVPSTRAMFTKNSRALITLPPC